MNPLPVVSAQTVHLELWAARENLTELQRRVVELMEQVEHIQRQHHELRVRACVRACVCVRVCDVTDGASAPSTAS